MNMNRAGIKGGALVLLCVSGWAQASFWGDVLGTALEVGFEISFQDGHYKRVIAIERILHDIVCEMPRFARLFPSHDEQAVLHAMHDSWRVLHTDWLHFVDDYIYDYGFIPLPVLDDVYDAFACVLCSMQHAHRVPYCAYYILRDADSALGVAVDYIQPNYAGHVWPDSVERLIFHAYEIDHVLRSLY